MVHRIFKATYFFASVTLLLFVGFGCASTQPAGWPSDIEQFRNFVLETHPKFSNEYFANIERNVEMQAAFNADIDALIANLHNLDDFEIMLYMQHAAAILRDNHFCILSAQLAQQNEIEIYPVGFRFLSDGFYLLTTTEPFAAALNHRLVAVGGRDIDDVFTYFTILWSVENVYHAKSAFARMINNPLLLDALHLRDGEQVVFTLGDAEGEAIDIALNTTVLMDTLIAASFPTFPVDNREEGAPPRFMDIRGRAGSGHNWFEFIQGYDILYIRLELYLQNIDSETGIFAPFAQDVKLAFEEFAPRAVIVDARYNPGGDNAYLTELFEFLAQNTASGMLFHFVDEGSMSGSLLAAAHLKSLGAILVGQPLGQNTSFYGFHTTTNLGELDFGDLSHLEEEDPDEIIRVGISITEYPYHEVLELTIREFLELAEGGSYVASPHLTLSHSGLHISVPNVPVSTSDMFNIDLEFYALRPHVLINYTIQDWINNRDPLLMYVLEQLE